MSEPRVLRPEDSSAIVTFEQSRLAARIPDPMERELMSWHASWRKESLEHYLPQGWSFGLWNGDHLAGYFLAQPQLFVRTMTQTLWVERLVAETPQGSAELIEIAYRIAREKHFQKVLFYVNDEMDLSQSVFQLEQLSDQLMELKTAKF